MVVAANSCSLKVAAIAKPLRLENWQWQRLAPLNRDCDALWTSDVTKRLFLHGLALP
jgi:hypothetical protein